MFLTGEIQSHQGDQERHGPTNEHEKKMINSESKQFPLRGILPKSKGDARTNHSPRANRNDPVSPTHNELFLINFKSISSCLCCGYFHRDAPENGTVAKIEIEYWSWHLIPIKNVFSLNPNVFFPFSIWIFLFFFQF